jgi:quercetin dioxygenase-like cupin family protein
MRIVHLSDAPAAHESFVAVSLVETSSASLRVIRLAPGQHLPPHTHGASDLFLLVVEGRVTLDTEDGDVALEPGALAVLAGAEELRAMNDDNIDVLMVAFLSPPFPPKREA